MTATDVRLLNICKSFGRATVIDDVSLTVGGDEFVVFLGPSGCGKSTLLRMIAGLESPDSGEIWIGDRRVDSLPPGERGVAMVFQHYALYPHMTVRDNMAFGLRNLRMPAAGIERRVAEAAALLEIEPLLDRKPVQISGGQCQRVAIGRAIVKEPRLFLFDEPLSNLDAALRVRTRLEIARLHQRVRAAMIFVTHDQVEAMTLAKRIVVLNNNRIEQVGTPMEIYARPATQFVAGFVGTPAMNFLSVELCAESGGHVVVRFGDGSMAATRIAAGTLAAGRDYRLGVRAESAALCATGEGDTRGAAEFVERLGDRTLVYVRLANEAVVICEAAGMARVAPGDAVGVHFDADGLHLFDDSRAYHATSADVS